MILIFVCVVVIIIIDYVIICVEVIMDFCNDTKHNDY